MLFNSINYFIFLFVVVVLNYALPHRFRWLLMLIASIVFYGIGGLSTIAVPVVIILTTFYCGKLIEQSSNDSRKKLFFFVGLFVTLGLLIFYKYINFFLGVVFDVTNLFSKFLPLNLPVHNTSLFLNLVIPLGISYIAFQAIGYLIEIKRGNHSAESHLGYFATYMLFFPKLLSGPIERAHNFLPQLTTRKSFDYDLFIIGCKQVVWGLFLKLIIANRLSKYTGGIFEDYSHQSGIVLLSGCFFYTFELFADFAGYTSIAIGSAQLLGFQLMENFNRPFRATTIAEFWNRWHISLSSWVTDYIYTPLVIKYRDWNKWSVVYAGMLTFLILGFWHGASWNYLVFGFLQGFILSAEFLTRKFRKKLRAFFPKWFNTTFGMIYVFSYFSFSLLFFKMNDLGQIFYVQDKIVKDLYLLFYPFDINSILVKLINNLNLTAIITNIMFLSVLLGFDFFSIKIYLFKILPKQNIVFRWFVYFLILFGLLFFGVFENSQFIYTQF